LSALQRVLHRVEHHLDDLGGFLLREPDFAAHAVDDVCLGHRRKEYTGSANSVKPQRKRRLDDCMTQCDIEGRRTLSSHLLASRQASPKIWTSPTRKSAGSWWTPPAETASARSSWPRRPRSRLGSARTRPRHSGSGSSERPIS